MNEPPAEQSASSGGVTFTGMLLALFLVTTAYALFLAAGVEEDWPAALWLLAHDDRLVAVVTRLVPLLDRYRDWMTANNYPANVALMEGVYSAAWLAFAGFAAAGGVSVSRWADRIVARWRTTRFDARMMLAFAWLCWALLGVSLFVSYVGYLNFDSCAGAFRGLNECIHINPWYAAKASFAIACDFYALFLPLSMMLAARRIRALHADNDTPEI